MTEVDAIDKANLSYNLWRGSSRQAIPPPHWDDLTKTVYCGNMVIAVHKDFKPIIIDQQGRVAYLEPVTYSVVEVKRDD